MGVKERRQERKERRKARQRGRAQLMGIAAKVYEPGDDVESLREKITEVLELDVEDRPWLAFLMELLEMFGPLLLKLLSGL